MTNTKKIKILTVFFFLVTILLSIAEYCNFRDLVFILKPLLVPTLAFLYFISAKRKCTWYLLSLLFALISNVFLLFSSVELLFLGIVTFLLYRLFSIVAIIKNGDTIFLIPLFLATIPFLIMFSYLIYTMVSPDNPNFFATVINDLVISIFSGIGLSSYIMNDNKQNSCLLISTLLFAFLVILFMFENFYLSFQIFKPLSALVFAVAHYTFFKFMETSKN